MLINQYFEFLKKVEIYILTENLEIHYQIAGKQIKYGNA